MSRLRCLRCSTRPRVWQRILPCARRQRVKPLSAIFRRCKLPHTLNSLPNLARACPGGQVAACQSTARLKTGIHILRAFFSRFTQGASAKTVWGSMRAEQVSIAQRWRRPRSDPEYRKRGSDTGEISEKCSSPNGGKSSEYTKQRSDTGPATEKCARVDKMVGTVQRRHCTAMVRSGANAPH